MSSIIKKLCIMSTTVTLQHPAFAQIDATSNDSCLLEAFAKLENLKSEADEAFQVYLNKCDVSGHTDFVDKCYAIASRQYQQKLNQYEEAYQLDISQCPSVE